MSSSYALGVTPDQRPVVLTEFRNAYGWAPSIWSRLLKANDLDTRWLTTAGGPNDLTRLWGTIDELPDWQQVPLLLTFDTGVIPAADIDWAADMLDEFERRCPEREEYVNHVPGVVVLLRGLGSLGRITGVGLEQPYFGMWGTSVSPNPFDPWNHDDDCEGNGIPLDRMRLLNGGLRRVADDDRKITVQSSDVTPEEIADQIEASVGGPGRGVNEMGVRYVPIEGCAIPVPDGAEWTLRYGTPDAREAQRYGVASVVNAYSNLLDPNRTQADAIAMLKRSRRAASLRGEEKRDG